MSENDFECFAKTGVNTPETMFSYSSFPEHPRFSAITFPLIEPAGKDLH